MLAINLDGQLVPGGDLTSKEDAIRPIVIIVYTEDLAIMPTTWVDGRM